MAVDKRVRNLRINLRAAWRPRIVARDEKCLACGHDGSDPVPLEAAHVTPVREFRRVLGPLEGTRQSFRPNNLVTLCSACHAAQEKADRTETGTVIQSAKLNEWLERQLQDHPEKTISELLEFERREPLVRTVFAQWIAKRGWATAEQFVAKNNLRSDAERAGISTPRSRSTRIPGVSGPRTT